MYSNKLLLKQNQRIITIITISNKVIMINTKILLENNKFLFQTTVECKKIVNQQKEKPKILNNQI